MAKVTLISDKRINRICARHPKTQVAVWSGALRISRIAAGRLDAASKKRTGHSQVTVSRLKLRYGRIDWFVNLEDPGGNALSIEYGHKDKKTGKDIPGKHIFKGWRYKD